MTRHALVTGAAAGIGRATAAALAEAGWRLTLLDRDATGLDTAARRLREAGASVDVAPVDLVDAAATRAAVAEAAARAPLAAIVNSAALFPQRPFADATAEEFDEILATNVRAPFVLAKAAVDFMPAGGALVLLTSISARMDKADHPYMRMLAMYHASKAALDRWVAGTAADLAGAGIVTSTLCSGAFVATEGTARVDTTLAPPFASIDAATVGRAVAWLAANPRPDHVAARFTATTFGTDWGAAPAR